MTPELAHSLDSIFPHIANSRRGVCPLNRIAQCVHTYNSVNMHFNPMVFKRKLAKCLFLFGYFVHFGQKSVFFCPLRKKSAQTLRVCHKTKKSSMNFDPMLGYDKNEIFIFWFKNPFCQP